MDWKNKLYFGDNLKILREHVPDASVDLIYLDPPFNSSATYNVLFKEKSGEESAAQITAFEDTWQWSKDAEAVYREIVESGPRKLADLVQVLPLAGATRGFGQVDIDESWFQGSTLWQRT
jgi:16S rRNA G966 N2-methylase RsmD